MSTGIPGPDINEAGRTLAQLNDWRAIVFVLVFIIVVMTIERLWNTREARLERKQMRDIANNFAESATKVGDALAGVEREIIVLRALAGRVEANAPTGGDDGSR